jgi:hypothetical protein
MSQQQEAVLFLGRGLPLQTSTKREKINKLAKKNREKSIKQLFPIPQM